MRQYDVVVIRLSSRARSDEEALSDLLNERARSGWQFHSVASTSPRRMLVIFSRDTA